MNKSISSPRCSINHALTLCCYLFSGVVLQGSRVPRISHCTRADRFADRAVCRARSRRRQHSRRFRSLRAPANAGADERTAWLLLAGAVAAAGIWSTHFLTIRAYTWDVATAYDLLAVAATLLAATIATTAGLAFAAPEGRWQAAAGGALIGLGIVVTHVVGVKVLDVPATLHRNVPVAMLVNVLAVALCCAAMLVQQEFKHRWMPLAASGLLAFTICGFHLAALGTLAVTPDPALAQTVSDISGTTLTIVVACTTAYHHGGCAHRNTHRRAIVPRRPSSIFGGGMRCCNCAKKS